MQLLRTFVLEWPAAAGHSCASAIVCPRLANFWFLCSLDGSKHLLTTAVIAHSSVVALDGGVLGRLVIFNLNFALCGLNNLSAVYVFTAIVTTNILRLSTLVNYLFQGSYDAVAGQ